MIQRHSESREPSSSFLLDLWSAGDESALETLLERHLPFLEDQVHRRLGTALRTKEETHDLVQDCLLELLRHGPRFRITDEGAFRGLLVRIVENLLCDKSDWYRAKRRDLARERPLAHDTVLYLDAPVTEVPGPESVAARREQEARVRLALELLPEDARRLVLRRDFDGASFVELAKEWELGADAVRMRYHRALVALGRIVERLERGEDGDAPKSRERVAPRPESLGEQVFRDPGLSRLEEDSHLRVQRFDP